MDDKTDITIDLNKVVVPKFKQGVYGSKDCLHNLELSAALIDPKFGVTSHFISSHDDRTDIGNQTKHQYIKEVFVNEIAKVEVAQIMCTQYDFMDVFIVPTICDKNTTPPGFM